MNPHKKNVFFAGKVLSVGDSLMITIPASNCRYMGIEKGDHVECMILKTRKG